jgi:hypothetical protein
MIMSATKKTNSNFEENVLYTKTILSICEAEWANVDANTIRLIVMIYDKVKEVGGNFSLNDLFSIRANIEDYSESNIQDYTEA